MEAVKVSARRRYIDTPKGRIAHRAAAQRYYEINKESVLVRQREYQRLRYAAKKEAVLTSKAVVV